MPASGKSTAGVILAKLLGMDFLDTDLLIQRREGGRLNEILDIRGLEAFLRCEEAVVLSVDVDDTVIATGGSVIYSPKAMRRLAERGTVVYLKVGREELFGRLKNIHERGVVLKDGESLSDMYENRKALYEKYADIIVEEKDYSIEDTVRNIIERVKAEEGRDA
ncbi:MAG: shikimate kinase [Lachnospiraceae bacterium]|nr:shikimate kinase [Lachnospiraceae bacterium]